jgi:eukaryotic-like serine/threonine-protein kinase
MDPAVFAERRVGATLRDKWTLERLLGTGGMAAVYVGVHRIGQRAAIKILHPDVARSPELRARFEQEAHAVNRFKHPGAVEIRDIDVAEDGAPFLVMELLEGSSLAEHAEQRGGLETSEVLRFVDELLDVLAAAHAQGIVHRDIKPDNLFVTRDGRLKVLDFGIARVKQGVAALHTRTGAMLGTTPYMAPEQIRGADVDARVDIFAVGATMFRLLARRRIHDAESEPMLLIKMATQPAPPLASVAPEVPHAVALMVDRALAFDRADRYPDAVTMQRDVRALRAGTASFAAPLQVLVVEQAAEPSARANPAELAMTALAPVERTVPVSFVAPVPPAPALTPQRRDEARTVFALMLGLFLVLGLAVVVVLLVRPATASDADAPEPPPTDDPRDLTARDPPARERGSRRPPEPAPPPRPDKGHGHGHGHGKGKDKDKDRDRDDDDSQGERRP